MLDTLKSTTGTIQDNQVKIVLVAVTAGEFDTTTNKVDLTKIVKADGTVDLDRNTNQTPEGGKLYYVAVAVDKDGKPLDVQAGTVKVSYGETGVSGEKQATLTGGGLDILNNPDSATIGTVFEVDAKDDYYAEGDEKFTVTISNPQTGTDYKSTVSVDTDHNKVTSTIKDNPEKVGQPDTGTGNDDPTDGNYGKDDTVYVKITQAPSTIEGGNLVHTITLVDKDGNLVTVPTGQTVTVNLLYSAKSGDFTEDDLSTIVKSVTITDGKSSENFTNTAKDDFTYEGDEIYNVTISSVTQSGAFENVAIHTDKTTTGTIKDGITLGTPVNASVDEDNFDVTDDNTTITDTKSLGIQKPNNPDNNYTLSFDNTATKIYQGDFTSTTDYGLANLKAGGQTIHYQTIGNKIIGYIGVDVGNGAVADSNKVFEIVLNKDSGIASGTTTKDSYTYTQYKNIDHPIAGDSADATNDDDLTFEFGFKITDQGQTSNTVNFKVKVNDSLPINEDRNVEVNEDNSLNIVISPESFKDGEIQIRVNGDGTTYTTLANDETIRVTDPNDNSIEIGTLTNNGDGTVTFVPDEDYSNYNAKPWFEYAVSDFDGDTAAGRVNIDVKPVADAPTIFVKDITTTEDAGNTKEGTNKVDLGLKVPFLSKDSDKDYSSETTTGYTAKQNNNQNATPTLTPSGDKNNASGDSPERNGEITLKFTNGNSLVSKAENKNIPNTGAKLFYTKDNGDITEIENFLINSNKNLKVVIVETSGLKDIDTKYHYNGLTPSAGTNEKVVYLTKSEYESLKIQHAEDNDTDIKISIKVTSYEVKDDGTPLLNDSTYTNGMTQADKNKLKSETTANMTVKINPVTDDIELKFDGASNTGTLTYKDETGVDKTLSGNITNKDSGTANEITFTDKIKEGSGAIDLKSILSNTSGALNGTGGTKGDLDGSEKRTYTIEGIPEGTIVKIGSTQAIAGADGKATLTFKDAQNKLEDPDFTMEFPKTFGGGVKATITLSVYDKGVDSTDIAGDIKTQTVYLNLDVEAVATEPDLNTIQVSQAIGFEDAGRSNGNTENPSDTINENGIGGIPLNIKVSSTDTDGSETANVKISDIPNGSALYVFDNSNSSWKLIEVGTDGSIKIDGTPESGSTATSGNITVTKDGETYTVVIKDYQNDKAPKFIPPHNDDTDATLKVFVEFVDTVKYNGYIENDTTYGVAPYIETKSSGWSSTGKDLSVIVKNVADAPVGTGIAGTKVDENEYTLTTNATEDTPLNLNSIYSYSADLKSSDDTEELTVRIKFADGSGVVLDENGNPYKIDDGEYVVKVSDIQDNKVNIKFPDNFSGNTSFDLTYVTTEKAGENDSKTWHTDKINIFVNPIADNVEISNSSTIYEDNQGGNGNKIDLKPTLTDTGTINGTETVEGVKILASSVPTGYTLYSDEAMTQALTKTGDYYVLTKTQWENGIYSKNNTSELVQSNPDFTLEVTYTVKDTNESSSDTKEYTHDHKVIVKAVTDAPTLTLGSITGTAVTISESGTTVTVQNDTTSTFTIPVTTTSSDKDGSEKVQEIIISGVPKGVEVVGATYYGYSGSPDNGIWVIKPNTDATKNLDTDGASQDIVFKVNKGADFESRPIIITTYTKDEATDSTEIKSDTKTITIKKSYTSTGPGTGNPPKFDLTSKITTIYEDNDNKDGILNDADIYNLGKSITVTNGGGGTAGNWAITITDFPEGTKVEGKEGVNIYTYEQGGKTHYVITGTTTTGNVADINTALSNVIVTPPTDMNTGGDKNGQMTFNATISTSHNGTYYQGTPIKDYKNDITPVTDEMTVSVVANNINEDTATPITITLSNPSDVTKTTLIGNSITIKVSETWKDNGNTSDKGILTYNGITIIPNAQGEYIIDGSFTVNTPITGLVYTPAANRDGDVKFEVSVQNKEGNSVTLTSKGDTTIKVTPVIDMVLNPETVIATGIEDTATTINGVTLQNAVKLEIKAEAFVDQSEKFTNIVLDEVPNGFTVWYKDSTGTLQMATNIGQSGTGFVTNPNIAPTETTHYNQWLVPQIGDGNALPEIYINAPTNWSGDFDFKAQFTLKEQNLTTTEKIVVAVTGKITPVADGVTIDPTLTFGKAFEWIDLKLNANMKDVDGSETMSLELSGLSNGAMFKVGDKVLDVNQAKYEAEKWTITGIKYDEINKIEFMNDKTVETVNVKAWTVEQDKDGNPLTGTDTESSKVGTFNLDIKDVGGILELDKGINLDFSKLSTDSLKGLNTIDLSKDGKNKLENLKLSDVLSMTNNKGELIIKGDNQDEVSFLSDGSNTWTKSESAVDGYYEYTNTSDPSVKVKVENTIVEQVIII